MDLFSTLAPIHKAFAYLIMQDWDSFKSVPNGKFLILGETLMKIPFNILNSQSDSKDQMCLTENFILISDWLKQRDNQAY